MKLLHTFKYISIFFLFLAFGCGEKNPYLDIEIPTPSKAENIRYESSDFPYGKALHYQIKVEFPATDVIELYNKTFSKLGYKITEYNPKSDSKWTLFSQKILEFQEVTTKPATWSASWTDIHKKNQFILSLNYPDKNSQYLYVICGIQPYFSTKALDDLFKKISEAGDFETFNKLLEKYETKGNSTDIKKALKENPDNQYLREYSDIITGKTKHYNKGFKLNVWPAAKFPRYAQRQLNPAVML